MIEVNLGGLGPFPFKDCSNCDRCWPLAAYRGFELCFKCMSQADKKH
jgi:hypothetical protein